ncbi:MAG: hypothetical protein UY63_C0005G0080 [Parcubacteria group bacterium GW2011_GWA2_51_10]|nr:MAG: hypothetical protein UY63_C0005G0080 [Parcubacteria group bacterium GW2011_GWA2_51_10]
MKKDRIAIVCSGGGMRCAYTGGALVALAREKELTSPDFIIASSGSAAFALYYLAGQLDAIQDIATYLLSTPKFISFLRPWKIMDIDYLIDVVFKEQRPLDVKKLQQAHSDYFIGVTESGSRRAHYISKSAHVNEFELLRATKAIPILYNGSASLFGKRYIDGAVSISFEDSINKAFELGATKIIGIDNRSQIRLRCGKMPSKVALIAPYVNPAKLITRNARTLTAAFESGYSDALAID